METQLRAALIAWLRADPALKDKLNSVAEEAPNRATIPWLGIAASASSDWSTKDHRGREIRIAVEIHLRGDDPATGSDIVSATERRVEEIPSHQNNYFIVSTHFFRARAEQRPGNIRAVLLEYRFRILED